MARLQKHIRSDLLTALVFATVAFSMMASPANASMAAVICDILDMVQADLGRAVATMGVLSVAIGAALGKVSWGLAITVAVGCSLMFHAQTYAGYFGVGGGC